MGNVSSCFKMLHSAPFLIPHSLLAKWQQELKPSCCGDEVNPPWMGAGNPPDAGRNSVVPVNVRVLLKFKGGSCSHLKGMREGGT